MQNWRKLNILAQLDNPTKGDWASEVQGWIIEYEIGASFKEVLQILKSIYEKIVHEKVKIEESQYFESKVKSNGSARNAEILEAKSSLEQQRPN